MSWLLLLLACGGGAHEHGPDHDGASAEASADHADGHGDHDDGHHGEAHPHKVGSMDHRFEDPDKWSDVFDDPKRDAWQKPEVVVKTLQLEPGNTVADIGAGTGYFNPHLAEAVGREGTVIAVDIEPTMVEHMSERAVSEGTPQVTPRLGAPDDPKLEEQEVDGILLVDTYHHIDQRELYFGALLHAVKDDGRLVIVDFKKGDLPVGPPEEHRIAPAEVTAELEAAGWALADQDTESLPYQYVLAFTVRQ